MGFVKVCGHTSWMVGNQSMLTAALPCKKCRPTLRRNDTRNSLSVDFHEEITKRVLTDRKIPVKYK